MGEDALQYIDDLRKASGMTYQQIAEQSGIPSGTVSRILAGQTKDPSYITLSSIIVAMGGSMDELSGLPPREVRTSTVSRGCGVCNGLDQALTASRDAYTHAYNEIKNQHEVELARVKQYLRIKDRWLVAMFAYCIAMTMILIFK